MQRHAVWKEVGGRQQCGRRVESVEFVDLGAVLVEADRRGGHPHRGDRLAKDEQAVGFHRDRPAIGEHPRQQFDGVAGARADDDGVGRGAHPSGAAEVFGQRLPQFGPAARVTAEQCVIGRGGQRPARRCQPRGAGEGRDVRRAGHQVVRRPAGGAKRQSRRPDVTGIDHPRARALPRRQPALGDQVGVRLRDGVAGQSEISCQRPSTVAARSRWPAGPSAQRRATR